MTSWHSLLACAQADVTIERIQALAASTGTEPLTVDFKEKASARLADCAAAMANTHGGLIFVGITDTDRKLVGVRTETMAHVADTLTTRLDPADWLPEMFEVPLPGQPGRHVLVLRIRRELAPRPVMAQRSIGSGDDKTNLFWIPVRIPGGTRQATRAEMAALFAERPAATRQIGHWEFDAPQIPGRQDGQEDDQIDMVLKTGLRVPPGPACPGRALSERTLGELAAAVDKSPLADILFTLTGLRDADVNGTRQQGHNTSAAATLVWQIAHRTVPPAEMIVRIEAPGQYGHAQVQDLTITIEVRSRLTAWRDAQPAQRHQPSAPRWLAAPEWAALLDAALATLTGPPVVAALADLADTDPILVPPPQVLHVTSSREITSFLPPQLRPIPGAARSRGAHVRADPELNLADPRDRAEQVTRWLTRIAADAGVTGMQALAAQLQLPARPPIRRASGWSTPRPAS
jgi:Putative DNA-binding domain